MTTHPEAGSPQAAGHEPLSASPRGILLTGAGVVVLVGSALALMAALLGGLDSAAGPRPQFEALPSPARGQTPPIEVDQQRERREWETGQRALLGSYGWIAPEQGIARIPIDRAMELSVSRAKGAQ